MVADLRHVVFTLFGLQNPTMRKHKGRQISLCFRIVGLSGRKSERTTNSGKNTIRRKMSYFAFLHCCVFVFCFFTLFCSLCRTRMITHMPICKYVNSIWVISNSASTGKLFRHMCNLNAHVQTERENAKMQQSDNVKKQRRENVKIRKSNNVKM